MKIILIMALIGAVLYAIDMLVCKISPKAGYMVAIFNLPFLPVGIVTFILTQKYLEKTLGVSDVTQYFRESGESAKQKKKKGKSSANISQKAAEVQANKRIELVIPEGTTEINDREFENREDIISVVIPKGVNRIRKQAFAGCKNLKTVSLPDDITISCDAFLYCNKLSDDVEQKIADKVEGMYSKSFVNGFRYSTPNSDPNYDTTGEGLDTNKFIYETRRAQNGEFYTVCFSCLDYPKTHTDNHTSSTQKTEVTESQTSVETIANTKKSESVNGKHGRLIFNDPYGKFTNQTASVPKDYGIEIGVQAKNGQPVALTIKVTGRKYEKESNTNSYFKADYNMLQVKDFPLVAVQMTKYFDMDFSDEKKETYRALIGSRIKTITKEQYESLGFDFKVNEKNHEANDKQDKLSDQTSALIIPEGTTEIRTRKFKNRKDIVSVVIPKGVKTIGEAAFENCENLKSVHISSLNDWFNIEFENFFSNPLSYAEKLYVNGEAVTKFVVPEGVTEIKSYSFYRYKGLSELVIPKGVTEIGEFAFYNCENLKTIHIPDSVKRIEKNAFRGCKNLTSVVIPEGVTTIEPWTFAGCASLETVVIPESVTAINDKAFFDCKSLKNVHISSLAKWCNIEFENHVSNPLSYAEKLYVNGEAVTKFVVSEGVTEIKSYSFYDYKGLNELVIPKGVTKIGGSAFSGCKNLKSAVISESVTDIGSGAFLGCESLKSVYISNLYRWCNINFGSGSSNILSYAEKLYVNGEAVTRFVVPKGVTKIKAHIFEDYKGLEKLKIHGGVTEIERSAFKECENLTAVKIPNGVTKIGDAAFAGCKNLTALEISKGVTEIGDDAFSRCSNLESVVIPEGVTKIECGAFRWCEKLTDVKIPKGVRSINARMFEFCKSLETVVIPDSVQKIGMAAFYGCSNLTSADIPKSVTEIGSSAFKDCINLESIVIPNGVKEIERETFWGCKNLTSVVIPEGVTKIEETAFSFCTNLDSGTREEIRRKETQGYPYDTPWDDPNYDPYYDPVYPSHPRVERETKSGQRYWARF